VLASALLLARVATDWGAGTRERRWALGVCAAVLAAHAGAGFLVEPDMALHETRVEIARGLRWMRDNTPSPGPWNAPRAQQDYGVLSVPARGAEIAWEARRPAVFSVAGMYGNLDTLSPTEKVMTLPGSVEFGMHSTGARYLVVTPLDMAEYESLRSLPEDLIHTEPHIGPIAWLELARFRGGDEGKTLKRVYASSRIVDDSGHAPQSASFISGPAISIWELPRPEEGPSTPQMLPR
jgi:hypothetical protein